MAGRTLKVGAVSGVLVVTLLYSGVGYFTGAVPFPARQRGEIAAHDLCVSLGDQKRAAKELEKVLPARKKYSVLEDSPTRMRDEIDWESSCFVLGDDDHLLYAESELAAYGTAKEWLHNPNRDDNRPQRFRAGEIATVTDRTAEILVPCVPAHEVPRGPYQLTVTVRAQQPLEAAPKEKREALATLALGTARAAHERARCSVPARVPTEVTGLR